ncbi:MAG: Hyaluronan synthase [Candidatus Ordinivivax streblomastigis]|uniref:Hyaluronan synthase n=1 Tax=Candidatus Ordinivivax streblomastigis TaxID=2540710 RepID=A0A5M8P529_9BACT|nr:MAG: Hyaluronan synthase [Candidatus Ordinivivax streblomastigis]
MPTVSVILPNYNHAPYLKQRIDSILNQTYQDFELILLDDCSPDDSLKIIKQYAGHPKISHTILNEHNTGNTFKQWAKGLQLAQGKYIWIAESDDWADIAFLESLVAQLILHPNAALAFSQSKFVDSEGTTIFPREDSDVIMVEKGHAFIESHLITGNAIYNASMCVFRKTAYEAIDHTLYEKMKYCGDWIFWSLLCEQGDVVEVKKPLSYFRRHNKNVSSSAELSGLTILEGFDVFLHNRKYLSNKKTYNRALIVWTNKWMQSGPFEKGVNRKILFSFLKKSPFIVCYSLLKKMKNIFTARI